MNGKEIMPGTKAGIKGSRWSRGSPVNRAGLSALVYIAICTLYIIVSSRLAAALATNTAELQEFEAIKGIAFVIVTGIIFFGISLAWWRKIQRQGELLIEAERRSVAAMYGAMLAHDLNNLLMILLGLVEGLKGREQEDRLILKMREDLERGVANLSALSRRLARSVRELQPQEKVEVDLGTETGRITELIRTHPDLKSCTVEVSHDPLPFLLLDINLFEQALINLILNAAQAAGSSGRIRVAATREGDIAVLEVHDNGPGIAEVKRDSIFDPGFTTKMEGTGLGLLSVQAFASSCDGRITVDRSGLGGALFRIEIPSANFSR